MAQPVRKTSYAYSLCNLVKKMTSQKRSHFRQNNRQEYRDKDKCQNA